MKPVVKAESTAKKAIPVSKYPKPRGLIYIPNFLSAAEQQDLLEKLTDPVDDQWKTAGHRANRLVRHFGYNYPYTAKLELTVADPIPDYIQSVIAKLQQQPGLENFNPDQAIINRYLTGEGISKHVDHVKLFKDTIVSVTVGSGATMRFRNTDTGEVFDQRVVPGSAYAMTSESRYNWTHEMVKSKAQRSPRYSITFREVELQYLKRGQVPRPPPVLLQPEIPKLKLKAKLKTTRSKTESKAKIELKAPDTKDKDVEIIKGDLLDIKPGPGEYIVHQTNCQSKRAAGLATKLFQKYRDANTYKKSSKYTRTPGTISVHGPIINLYGQDAQGMTTSSIIQKRRREWFQNGLDAISKTIGDATVIYFPYGIGCGMAGGTWSKYLLMISNWAKNQPFKVQIVDNN